MDNASPDIIDRLTQILGADGIITDADERDYYSQDVYKRADHVTSAVLRPANIEDLSEAVGAATAAGSSETVRRRTARCRWPSLAGSPSSR